MERVGNEKANEEVKLQLTPLHEVVNTVAEIINQHELTEEELNKFAISLIGIITSQRNAEINRLIGLNEDLITQINNGTRSISSTKG